MPDMSVSFSIELLWTRLQQERPVHDTATNRYVAASEKLLVLIPTVKHQVLDVAVS